MLLGVYDGTVDETAEGLIRLRDLKSGESSARETPMNPFALLAGDSSGAFAEVKRERASRAVTDEDLEAHKRLVHALAALVTLAVSESTEPGFQRTLRTIADPRKTPYPK